MSHPISRRGILSAGAATLAACSAPAPEEMLSADATRATGAFAHGIASGDPRADSVILWTRLTPENVNGGPVILTWKMSETTDFATITAQGATEANVAKNWAVKVEATGLKAGTQYFYQFSLGDKTSPIGQTRTLPKGEIDSVRFAVVSCSNWQEGYFNAYDHISRQNGIDAVIHLGDYFYEYGASKFEGTEMAKQGHLHEPRHEVITLEDYRIRHAQYRTDPSLQAMSAKFPMIMIWDDHESSNDSWKTGAQNHDPETEGPWEDRKQAAMRAYYEWLPIREPEAGKTREHLFRALDYGDLLSLVTVETRLTARAEPLIIENHIDEIGSEEEAEAFKTNVLGDPAREMFGQIQEDFIVSSLQASKDAGQTWRVLANQVIMARLISPDMEPYIGEDAILALEPSWPNVRDAVSLSKYGFPLYADSWEGYPAARERFFNRLDKNGINDIFVLTGDAHEFWMNDLSQDDGKRVGIEVVTTSVSSETLLKFMGENTEDYSLLMTQANKDARYYNAMHNGYLDITFTPRHAAVRMMAVSTTKSRDYFASEAASFTVQPKKESLNISNPKGLNLKQRALFNGLG